MKKSILAAAVLLVLSMGSQVLAETKHGEITKVTDYLYEITYTDYDYADYLKEMPKMAAKPAFGCSSVHNGQFYGRNMDFYFDENPEFVIRVPKAKNRFASVGVALNFVAKNIEDYAKNPLAYTTLPWETLDGINENGVAANINVCPANDLKLYIAKEGTNPKKQPLYLSNIVRYVLDNAKTAKHGMELLENRNIVQDFSILYPDSKEMQSYGLHIMIADEKEQYIVEWRDNKMYYTKDDPIMTNFFNTLPGYTPHAQGTERYDILKKNYYSGGASMEAMTNLMRKVQFYQAYDKNTENFWYSDQLGYWDALGIDFTHELLATNPNLRKKLRNHILKNMPFRRNTPDVWQTVNTSVYDLKNLKLRLFVQENYDKYYEYSL